MLLQSTEMQIKTALKNLKDLSSCLYLGTYIKWLHFYIAQVRNAFQCEKEMWQFTVIACVTQSEHIHASFYDWNWDIKSIAWYLSV